MGGSARGEPRGPARGEGHVAKKKDTDRNIEADFFGDDLDWLDDESEQADASRPPPSMPVAPPPPPPPPTAGRTAQPLSPDQAAWANKVPEGPTDLKSIASAPTLVFSSVPTLPPEPAPDLGTRPEPPAEPPAPAGEPAAEEPAAEEPPAEAAAPPPPEPTAPEGPPTEPPARLDESTAEVPTEIAESELPTVEVDTLPTGADSAPPPSSDDDELPEVFGDELDGQDEETPVVRTHDPAPARIHVSEPEEPAPFGAPAAPVRPREQFVPRGAEQSWRDTASSLVAEAGAAKGGAAGALFAAAAHVHHVRLAEVGPARELYHQARGKGFTSPEMCRALADIAADAGFWDEAATELEALGRLVEGAERADVLCEAAEVVWQRLGNPAGAATLLREARAADPDCLTAVSLMRQVVPALVDDPAERAEVLGAYAELSEGTLAAEALKDQAEALLAADQRGEARAALELSRELDPGNTEAFLMLAGLLAEHPGDLAALYESEASREGQPDAGWWYVRAARAHRTAGNGDGAHTAYGAAVAAGYVFAEREQQAAFARAGMHAEVARSLRAEADALQGSARAFALYRMGTVLETQLGDAEGALAAYHEALSSDDDAAPAAEAILRALRSLGRSEELAALLLDRREGAPDADDKALCDLRLGELAEKTGEHERALVHYRAAAEAVDDGGAPVSSAAVALQGVQRTLRALGRFEELSRLYAQRASSAGDDAFVWHYLAATAAPVEGSESAIAQLRAALAVRPADPLCLDRIEILLRHASDWEGLVEALLGAVGDEPGPDAPAFLVRAARILLDHLDAPDRAREAAEQSLSLDSAMAPARQLLREVAGSGEGLRALYRADADRTTDGARGWWLFASSLLTGPETEQGRADLELLLEEQPGHPGALATLEVVHLASGSDADLVELYRAAIAGVPSLEKARLAARVADMLLALGERDQAVTVLEDLCDMDVQGRPSRAASMLARQASAWALAARMLEPLQSAEDRLQRAWLYAQRVRNAEAARDVYAELADSEDHALSAGAGLAAVGQRADDEAAALRGETLVAHHATSSHVVATYGAWAGASLEALGNRQEALALWSRALDARPASRAAFEAVLRIRIAAEDAEAVATLFDAHRPADRVGRAVALWRCGAHALAAEQLSAELEEQVAADARAATVVPLWALLEQECALADDWQGAFDALSARREHTAVPEEIEAIEAKKRWILAEKLAETELAWTLYQQLHAESPDDTGVTEALARIAGARGDTSLAIEYLRDLAAHAEGDPEAAARYQCRIAEIHEREGDVTSARQAYLDALDHHPDHRMALDSLKRLATEAGEWSGVVAVLQREAGGAEPERKLELLHEIAVVTEERLEDGAVAMDAWRALIEVDPQNLEGLQHLVELSEQQEAWGVFVETGNVLAALQRGAERGALLRRVGIVCQDHLDRDDALRFFEQAVQNDPPDYQAAERLEASHRARSDWKGVIRALELQATAADTDEIRVQALERAARVELETRHDRDATAGFYERILAVQPHHEGALRFMAPHLFQAGRFDEALPICERVEPVIEEGQDLDDFDTRMELSSFYFYFAEMLRLGLDTEGALIRYERALALNPTHLASLEAVGPLYKEAASWKKAEQVYRQLLQLSGGQGERHKVAGTYSELGLVERELGAQDKAYKRFNKALEIFPNHVGALKGMALVLEDRKDWSNLLNIYNNIIYHATVPQDVIDAYMTKGRILDDYMSRPDKAAQHYQRSLDFDTNQPAAFLRLAELAMRRDDHAEAGQLADRALRLRGPEVDLGPYHALLLLVRAASEQAAGLVGAIEERLPEIEELSAELAADVRKARDLEATRQVIKAHLPI